MSKICKKRVHGNDKKIYLKTLKSVLGCSILHYFCALDSSMVNLARSLWFGVWLWWSGYLLARRGFRWVHGTEGRILVHFHRQTVVCLPFGILNVKVSRLWLLWVLMLAIDISSWQASWVDWRNPIRPLSKWSNAGFCWSFYY